MVLSLLVDQSVNPFNGIDEYIYTTSDSPMIYIMFLYLGYWSNLIWLEQNPVWLSNKLKKSKQSF